MADNFFLETIIDNHVKWSGETFPLCTAHGAMLHAEREIKELRESIENQEPITVIAEEAADVLGCFFDAMQREGISLADIKLAFDKKLEKNKKRTWIFNGDGSYRHVKKEEQFPGFLGKYKHTNCPE